MAIDIGELRGILTLKDQFSKPIDDAAGKVSGFSKSFSVVGQAAGILIGAVGAVTGTIVALGARGAAVDDVASAFRALTKSAGDSADVMLGKMRDGVKGTISDFELMKLANKALGAGLIKSSDDMGTLAEGARMLAKRAGIDTPAAFEQLMSAMASGRTTQLKQLGLFVDSKNAVNALSAATGESRAEMTDTDRAQALATATLSKLRDELRKTPPDVADFGEVIDKGRTAVKNFVDGLSVAIATSPVVSAGLRGIEKALAGAFGGKQEDAIKSILWGVEKFAIGLTYVAQAGVVFGDILVTAFYAVKTAVAAVMTVVSGFVVKFLDSVQVVTEFASKIPGVRDELQGFASGLSDARQFAEGLTVAMLDETKAAADGVLGHSDASAALAKMGGVIIGLRDSMKAAEGQMAASTESVAAFGAETEEAKARSYEMSKAVADSARKIEEELALFGKAGLDRTMAQLQQERDARVRAINELKGIRGAEAAEQIALEDELHRRKVAAAIAGGDALIQAQQALQDEIALMQTVGIENSLLALDQQQALEIEKLEVFKEYQRGYYDEQVKLVGEKFKLMRQAVTGYYQDITQQAAAAGFLTRAEQQATVDHALDTYNRMRESHNYSKAEMKRAEEAYHKAVEEMDGRRVISASEKFQMIASAGASALRDLFGKNKAAMIAAAIIETAAAVVTSFKNGGGFPWGLVPAAAMAAAGLKQIQQIRSQDAGFRQGTPDTAFLDFGPGALRMLHGPEAVVTKAQGESLAEMVRAAAEGGSGDSGMTIINNYDITEDPLQTFESRERQREFTLRATDDRARANLPRMLAQRRA